jgi:hypothetical protein
MHATTYQNHLDSLLAEEDDVCGKFNHLDCCLQIDENGQVVTNIATNNRKITHVPVQTWDGWKPNDWLGSWFSWLFPLLGPIAAIRAVLCFGPCLLNLLMHLISSHLVSIKLPHSYYRGPLDTPLGLNP